MQCINWLRSGFILLSLLFIQTIWADDNTYFTVTQSSTVHFPYNVAVLSQSVGDFIITNTDTSAHPAYVKDLPIGYQAIPAISLVEGEPTACGVNDGELIQPGKSCTMRIAYRATTKGKTTAAVLPYVCPQNNDSKVGCAWPKDSNNKPLTTTFYVWDQQNLPNKATIELVPTDPSSNSLDNVNKFAPNEYTEFTVKNIGPNPADDVHIAFVPTLQNHVTRDSSSNTVCKQLAKNQTCHLFVTMDSTLPLFGANSAFSIEGSNTNQIQHIATVLPSLLKVSPVALTKPNVPVKLTVTNLGNLSVTGIKLNDLSNIPTLKNVHVDNATSTCLSTPTLAPEQSCYFMLEAATNAYGNGTATVSFTPGKRSERTSPVRIAVMRAAVAINPDAKGKSQTIFGSDTGSGSFKIKNTGNFDLLAPTVKMDLANAPVTLTVPSVTSLAPSGELTVTYKRDSSKAITSPLSLTATGTNAGATSVNMLPSRAALKSKYKTTRYEPLVIYNDWNDVHMGYVGILILNYSDDPVTITSLTASMPSNGQLSWCGDSDSDCDLYFEQTHTTNNYPICTVGLSLGFNEICETWVKANAADVLTPTTSGSFTISVDTDLAGSSSDTFDYDYSYQLYMGGSFLDIDADVAKSFIMSFDGASFHSIMDNDAMFPVMGTVYSLMPFHGDLVAGGDFMTTGGSTGSIPTSTTDIASWDGQDWNAFGEGLQGAVYSLLDYKYYDSLGNVTSDGLVAGGGFILAGDGTFTLNHLGEWDSSDNLWIRAIGMDGVQSSTDNDDAAVYATMQLGPYIIAGGTFQSINNCQGTTSTSFLAYTNTSALCWQSFMTEGGYSIGDFDNTVFSLGYADNHILVGGHMTSVNTGGGNWGSSTGLSEYVPADSTTGASAYWTTTQQGKYSVNGGQGLVYTIYGDVGSWPVIGGDFTDLSYSDSPASLPSDTADLSSISSGNIAGLSAYGTAPTSYGTDLISGVAESFAKIGDTLYVGGEFTYLGVLTANFAQWSSASPAWYPFSQVNNGDVYAMQPMAKVTATNTYS